MSERDDLVEALSLAPAIDAINGCKSRMALEALRGEIDRRITELERNLGLTEQKGGKMGQTPPELGQKPRKTGKKGGSLNPLNHIDALLRDIKEPFTRKDLAKVLHNHYEKTLNHKISRSSAESYAYICIKRMLSDNLIEEAGKKEPKGRGKGATLYKKKPKKLKPEGAEDGIYTADDEGKQRLRETLGIERELCDTGHFEDLPEVT